METSGTAGRRGRVERSILQEVFAEPGPLTRVDIAARTGLSQPTVNAAVRRLEQDGLLGPAGRQTGRLGRVATFHALAPTAGAVVAVELNPTVIRVAIGDLRGRTISRRDLPPARSPEALGRDLERVVLEAQDQVRREAVPLRTVVVSVAKPVDPRTLDVIDLPDTPYPEGLVHPARILAGRIDGTLLVDNDVNLAAIGERHVGVATGVPSFAYLYVGAGIGGAIVVDGQLVRGAHGLAGEIGYLPSRADPSGGQHGLLRAIGAYGLGPRRRDDWYADTIGQARTLLDAAVDGDRQARAVVDDAGRALGEAAMAITAVVDPDLVVLGGPVGGHPLLITRIQETLDELAPAPTRVVASTLGETAPLQGALELARRHARATILDAG